MTKNMTAPGYGAEELPVYEGEHPAADTWWLQRQQNPQLHHVGVEVGRRVKGRRATAAKMADSVGRGI